MIYLKSKDEIQIMRRAGAIVANVLLEVKSHVKPGVTTGDLDDLAERLIRKSGATPTFIGYLGYPKTLCTSINQEIVHGIPGDVVLRDGDIIGIDCAVTYQGFVADHAVTLPVGSIVMSRRQLIEVTDSALLKGIEAFQLGKRIGDIGFAVESCARPFGYGVVRDFVGHGIGRKMHEEPQVPNFGNQGTGPRVKLGMVIAVEPMFNIGTHEVQILKDGWTVVTRDASDSAHFEHTVAMTEDGPLVLTQP